MAGVSQDGQGTKALKMNVQEFLGHFTVVYKASVMSTAGAPGVAGEEDGQQQLESSVREALGAIGKLITKTPADDLVSEMEKAVLKVQKCFRGNTTRKEVHGMKHSDAPAEEEATMSATMSRVRSTGGGGGS